MPTCEIGRYKSALCLKIGTSVVFIENAAKKMATMPVVFEKATNPGKKRKVTDALKTTASLTTTMVGFAKQKGRVCIGRTTRQAHAPMGSVGVDRVAYRRPLSSSISLVHVRIKSEQRWRRRYPSNTFIASILAFARRKLCAGCASMNDQYLILYQVLKKRHISSVNTKTTHDLLQRRRHIPPLPCLSQILSKYIHVHPQSSQPFLTRPTQGVKQELAFPLDVVDWPKQEEKGCTIVDVHLFDIGGRFMLRWCARARKKRERFAANRKESG